MEESVAGRCETLYSVKRSKDVDVITKTKDYLNCEKIPVFRRGVYGTNYDALMKKHDIIARKATVTMTFDKSREALISSVSKERIEIFSLNGSTAFSAEMVLREKGPSDIREDFELGRLILVEGLIFDEDMTSCKTGLCDYMNPIEFDSKYNGSKVEVVQELVEKVSQGLGREIDSLERFSNLVGVIRQMNGIQLKRAFQIWGNSTDNKALFVFQNALAQAGTLQALRLIMNHMTIGRHPLMFLPETAYPLILEHLDSMFKMAKDKLSDNGEASETDISHDVILAFTNLVRRYLEEKEPTFDRNRLDQLIAEKYRPYFVNKLSELCYKNDWRFQIYVRALGNMGELPFVTGNAGCMGSWSPFQRVFFINSMDKSVELHPEESRNLLMTVYKNKGESFSVRVASALKLFETDLPEDVVLDIIRIASESDNDEIINVVKAGALSEAYEYHNNTKIYEAAQELKLSLSGILNSRRLSTHSYREMSFEEGKKRSATYEQISGVDENPFSILLEARNEIRGFKSYFKIAGMIDYFTSNIRNILASFYGSALPSQPVPQDSSANLEISTSFAQLFIPLSNLNSESVDLKKFFMDNSHVKESLIHINELSIGFPTETGLPFLYSYQSPKYLSFELDSHNLFQNDVRVNVDLLLAQQEHTKAGFVNPITGKHYVKGIKIDRQIHIPVGISHKKEESIHGITIEPLFRDREQLIAHFATVPYFGSVDLFPVEPVKNIKVIKPDQVSSGENYLDEHERFRLSFNSSGSSLFENLNYFRHSGPFSEGNHTYESFSVFFKEHKSNRTSVIVNLDLAPAGQPIVEVDNDYFGENREKVIFAGRSLLKTDLILTGPVNNSLSLDLRSLVHPKTLTYKMNLNVGYSKNDILRYQTCLGIMYSSGPAMSESKFPVFAKLKFGPTCDAGGFISAEAEIEVVNSSKIIKAVVDFDKVPDTVSDGVCNLGEGFLPKKPLGFTLKIVPKDSNKCKSNSLYYEYFQHSSAALNKSSSMVCLVMLVMFRAINLNFFLQL